MQRLVEVVRRLALLGGVLGALWAALVPVPELIEVRPADFEALRARRPRFGAAREESLEAYIHHVTEGRRTLVSPTTPGAGSVAALHRAVQAQARGAPVPAPLADRVGARYGSKAIYLAPDADAIRALPLRPSDARPVVFVEVHDEQGSPAWLAVQRLLPRDRGDLVPSRLHAPGRRLALPILGVALLVYAVLPRVRRAPGRVRAHPVRAVVLPDLVGAMLAGAFAALPMLVVPPQSASGRVFDAEWVALPVVGGVLASFGAAILAVAAGYAVLRYDVGDGVVVRHGWRGAERWALADVVSVEPAVVTANKTLVRLTLLAGLVNPRLAGQGLLLASRADPAFDVVFRDGRRRRVVLTAVEDPAPLLDALAPFARGAAGPADEGERG